MKKVLVTGANSFTGQYLLPLLKSAGFETHGLTRGNSHNASATYSVDILDFEGLLRVINKIKPDYIIHLAGISFTTHPRPIELYQVNLLGTENLLRATNDAAPGIQKIILASSASIYGTCENSHIDENVCPSPINHYAASKLAMEHIAKTWMNRLPITIVRPFNYTGPGQDKKFLIPKIIDHFAKRAPEIDLGNTKIARDFTDVRIICKYYLKLLTEGKAVGETVNLCSGRLITLTEILENTSEISGHSLDIMVNPAFVRDSDILDVRGNPDKLYSLVGYQSHPNFKETLTWMLQQAC